MVAGEAASIGRPCCGNLAGSHDKSAQCGEQHETVRCYLFCARGKFDYRITCVFGWDSIVPPWLEILLDLIGFAGFIGLAIWHKTPRKDDEGASR
jgi:hypothetical protein